mgnify:CR=1 FL=1
MPLEKIHPLDEFIRTDRLPHRFCPGCGVAVTMNIFLHAIKELTEEGKLDPKKLVVISGIGCTGRVSGYLKFDGAHTPHGRSIPFGMGVKLANPELKVVVISGDGDIVGIGGNHLIHAARRNMDITVLMVNNFIYAMTGGQVAPTTPQKVYTTTTPYGNPESPFNIIRLIAGIGANYLARWAITQPFQLKNSIKKAVLKEGFSFIEVISTCPERFGKRLGIGDPVELYNRLKSIAKIRKVSPFEAKYDWNEEITCGEFIDEDKPGFVRMYFEVIKEKLGERA